MKKIYKYIGAAALFLGSLSINAQTFFDEDFTGTSGITPPAGWTNNDIQGGGNVWEFDNPGGRTFNTPITAPAAIFDSDNYGGGSEDAALESPQFDASALAGDLILSFDHYFNGGFGGEYFVEVFDGTTWVQVMTGTAGTGNPQPESIDITTQVDAAANAQVRFRWVGNYSWYWIVDNIKVADVTCPDPSALAVSNVTDNSVDLGWTENGSATTWNIEIGPTSFTPGTGNETTADNGNITQSSSFVGLTGNTMYDVYVQADCGGSDQSTWTGPLTITTLPTPQTPATTPWDEDWESGGSDWTILNGTETNQWVVGTAVNNGGANSLYISNDGGITNAYESTSSVSFAYRDITMPASYAEANVSFDWQAEGELGFYDYDYLSVWAVPLSTVIESGTELSASGSAPGGIVDLTNALGENATFINQSFTIPTGYAGEDFRLVFQWKNDAYTNNNPPAAVDNINITTFDCVSPSGINSTAITNNSVDVEWVENGSATTWNIEIGPTGFTPGTGNETTADNGNNSSPIASSLPGLAGNTAYDVYVQADCSGGGESAWTGPFTIVTPPDAQTPVTSFPYIEDFETGGTEWTVLANNETNKWVIGSAVSNGGSTSLYVTNDGGITNAYDNGSSSVSFAYRDITMPASYTQATVSFDWQADAETTYDHLIVWAIPSDSIPASGTELSTSGTAPTGVIDLTGNLSEDAAFHNQSFTIPTAYAGQTFRLVFQWKNDGSYGDNPPAAVDNINVSTFNCNSPFGVTTSDVEQYQATVSWNDTISSPNFTVEYGPAGFTPGTGTTTTVTDTFAILTGLNADQDYDFYVSGECSDATPSAPSSVGNFTTLVACASPTDFALVDVTSTSVELTWSVPIGGPSGYNIEYGPAGFTPGTGTSSAVPPATITGLSPETEYDFYVYAFCSGDPSQPTGPIIVTTEVSCPAPSNISFTEIGPDSVVVSWDENGSATDWVIEYDTTGFTQGSGTNPIINTSNNPDTLLGLDSEYTYDVYVWANCGVGDLSDTLGPVDFTTQPPCPAPSNISISEIGGDTAVVAWDANGTTSWVVEYDTVGFTLGTGTNMPTTDNPDTLTGLDSEYSYDVYVWADCGTDGASDTLGPIDFTTQKACLAPSNISISDIGVDSALVAWDENGIATSWVIEYDTVGFTQGSSLNPLINTIYNPDTLLGLSPEYSYDVYLWADCGTDGASDTLGPVDFTTQPTCLEPSGLTSTNINANDVDVTWVEEGTAGTWNVEIGPTGFVPGTSNEVTADNGNTTQTSNLAGLAGSTTYDVYVQADCGGGDESTWSGPLSVTTLCTAITAPWVEDFENAGSIPNCWNQGPSNQKDWEFANTGGFDHIGSNGTLNGNTNSDGYFAWLDDSSPQEMGTALLSPMIDVSSLSSPILSFYLISDNEGNTNVDFSVDVWDGTAWNTGVYTSNTNTANEAWEEIYVSLNQLTITGDIQFRFVVDENNGSDFYDDVAIDDVEIKEAPTCYEPIDVTVTNITATSSEVSWTDTTSSTSWIIEYGPAGFTIGSGTVDNNATDPYSITGLNSNTEYDVYVQTDCGGGDSSSYAGPSTFLTECATTMAPFTEDFSGTGIPGCWTLQTSGDITDASDNWEFTGNAGYGAANNGRPAGTFAWVDGSTPELDTTILITPNIDLTPLADPLLGFEWFSNNEDYPGDNNPLIVDVNDGSGWVNLDTLKGDNIEWMKESYNLSAYVGQTIQVRFDVNQTTTTNYAWYNDILLDGVIIGECALAGQDGSFDICRADSFVNLESNIITKPNTTGSWVYPPNQSLIVNDTLFNFQALSSGSKDVLYIIENVLCSDTTVATINVYGPSSAGMNGTIEVCKNAPIDLYAALTGNADLGGDWYDPTNQLLPNAQPTAADIPGNFNFDYVVSNDVCPADTALVEVSVLPGCEASIDEELFTDLSVYPNPARSEINIVNPKNAASLTVEMLDMNGRIVLKNTQALNNTTEATIAIDQLEKGVYTLRVYNESGQKTFKIVKQ